MQGYSVPLSLAETSTKGSRLRILYVAMKYDYGKPEQGYSFEHYNFHEALRHMGHDILYFDFMSLMQQHGQEWMNNRLLEVVKTEKPDLMFTALFMDELDKGTVRYISENTDTVTLNWFCDDHWKFDNYSYYWAPCFNWVVTTAESALPKYAKIGYSNVIKSQWGCNHFLYRKLDLLLKYDVTFVGQPHGDRRQVIEKLQQAGINVQVWGNGWETGRLSQEEMIQVFNTSRINLNLSNAFSLNPFGIENTRSTSLPRRLLSGCLNKIPFGARVKEMAKKAFSQMKKWRGDGSLEQHERQEQQYVQQIKGRNFEIPGCGGFLLTGWADNLEDYYLPDRDVVCCNDTSDLVDKIQYYLENEDERVAIAKAGYERTLRDHTYVQRFTAIFQQMGLPYALADEDEMNVGQTIEII